MTMYTFRPDLGQMTAVLSPLDGKLPDEVTYLFFGTLQTLTGTYTSPLWVPSGPF